MMSRIETNCRKHWIKPKAVAFLVGFFLKRNICIYFKELMGIQSTSLVTANKGDGFGLFSSP